LLLTPPKYYFYNFQVSVNDAYQEGQKVMGRANRRLGKLLLGLSVDLHFCGCFGVSAEVAVEAWEMMDGHNCLPPSPKFLHFFVGTCVHKSYPANDKALLIALGGSNPKTIHKYIWPLIDWIF
jgi:hypothetical protein